jgi:uncharacterized membrane protein
LIYRVEVIFLVFALFFGSVSALINPPFMASDETWHFFKAYDVSQGHLTPEKENIDVPKSFDNIIKLTLWNVTSAENYLINKDYSQFNMELNVNDTQVLEKNNAYSYMPLPYLGAALVIKMGQIFNGSPLVLMYFCRLINLLIYIIIVYYAIKIVPIGKYVFLLIVLMPMTLYTASSISADSLNLALCFFTICLFLKLAFNNDKIYKKDILLIFIFLSGLSLSKQLYVLLGMLFFIIPKSKFENLRVRLGYFIFTLLPSGLILVLWNHLFKNFDVITSSTTLSGSSHIVNFLSFFNMFLNTIVVFFDRYLISFVGYFGG